LDEFSELLAAFTDNSPTFSENQPGDFRVNNVKNRPNYPENQSLERKNRENNGIISTKFRHTNSP
jgi:hypothetical protein